MFVYKPDILNKKWEKFTLSRIGSRTCTNGVETNKHEMCKTDFGLHIFLQLFLIGRDHDHFALWIRYGSVSYPGEVPKDTRTRDRDMFTVYKKRVNLLKVWK